MPRVESWSNSTVASTHSPSSHLWGIAHFPHLLHNLLFCNICLENGIFYACFACMKVMFRAQSGKQPAYTQFFRYAWTGARKYAFPFTNYTNFITLMNHRFRFCIWIEKSCICRHMHKNRSIGQNEVMLTCKPIEPYVLVICTRI